MTMTPEQKKRIGAIRGDVRTKCNPDRLESWRDQIEDIDLPALADWYERYDDWDWKGHLLGIVQDRRTDEVIGMARDYLRVPPTNSEREYYLSVALLIVKNIGFHERIELSQAYSHDGVLFLRAVQEMLQELGMTKADEFPKKSYAAPPGVKATPYPESSLSPEQRELLDACKDGGLQKVLQTLEAGAGVNFFCEDGEAAGCTPLFLAARGGHLEIGEALIRAGSNVNHVCPQMFLPPYIGETPLGQAALHGHLDFVELLLDSDVAVDTAARAGETPLFKALTAGHYAVAQRLYDLGAKIVGETHPHRRSFLHRLVAGNLAEPIPHLMKMEAPTEKYDDAGDTPLLLGARLGALDCVQALLDSGADIAAQHRGYDELKPLKGMTALALAVKHDFPQVVAFLLAAGADPTQTVKEARQHDGSVLPERSLLELVEKPGGEVEGLLLKACSTY